jgi:hypothetical protein
MFEKIFQRFTGVFAVRTQPVRGLVLVPAIAFARGPTKPKPATNAQNLAKLITGAGGLGKYAGVMRPKQLPLRLGTLQKACAAARGGGALRSLRDVGRRGAELEKQFHSGLKGPQTSQPPTIWVGTSSAAFRQLLGVAELIVEKGGRALNPLRECPAGDGVLRSSERCGENPIGGGG